MQNTLDTYLAILTDILGEVPAEFEGLVYIFGLLFLLFVVKEFFAFFTSVFSLGRFDT